MEAGKDGEVMLSIKMNMNGRWRSDGGDPWDEYKGKENDAEVMVMSLKMNVR